MKSFLFEKKYMYILYVAVRFLKKFRDKYHAISSKDHKKRWDVLGSGQIFPPLVFQMGQKTLVLLEWGFDHLMIS